MNDHRPSYIDEPLSLLEPDPRGQVQILLARISNAWMNANQDEALGSCYAAIRCANRTDDLASTALAQLYLAETCARCGRLSEGADWARRAARRLGLLNNGHNVMVAHLLLGRIEHSLNNLDEAQTTYQQALDMCQKLLFEEKAAARGRADLYQQVDTEIQDAISEISTTMQERSDQTYHLESIPILSLSDGPDAATVGRSDMVGYAATTGEFLIAGRTYQRHPLTEASGNAGRFGTRSADFALAIPEDGWIDPHSQVGDYALVRRGTHITQEGPGVVWTGDNWVGGRFERDVNTGHIQFVAPRPYIIGEERGYVVALLKPIA